MISSTGAEAVVGTGELVAEGHVPPPPDSKNLLSWDKGAVKQ